MRNLKLTIRYDGTGFAGWQTQPGQRTVQETVERAIVAITREARVRLNCSGRTDAGVHAVGQVANVYTATKLPCPVLLKAFNSQLPDDVVVRAIDDAPQSFCANKDAIRKHYRYVIRDGRLGDPFLRKYSWFVRHHLDAAAMDRAGRCLLGRHDFRCFETEWPNRLTSVRTVTRLGVSRCGEYLWVDAEADGFLYNMVRAIAGTLVQVGRGYWPEERVSEILHAMDRRQAGSTAPYKSMSNYPAELEVVPLAAPPAATVTVPGSKSITNRALVLAALGGVHSCMLAGALRSEDTEVMLAALNALGVKSSTDPDGSIHLFYMHELGTDCPSADLFVGNSGTTIRFLTALLGTLEGRFRLDGVPRMRERPIEELLDGMRQLGVDARSEANNGCPPVVVTATGRMGGTARIRGDRSSQFLSGLLMTGPFTSSETIIEIDGPLVSEPYVVMTLAMIEQFGFRAEVGPGHRYRFPPGQPRNFCGRYDVEPDASAASYFWAAAAVAGGRVTVSGLTRQSLQGDVGFVDVLAEMGCRVEECEAGITVHGRPLRGVDVDMNAISDTVMTLGAVALFADGPTTIRNVGHIRHKETDRIAALATELRKLGAAVDERADGLTITPGPLRGAAVDTYNDHRMAMSLALVGLRVPGVVVRNPGCVAKTYPGFWEDLEKLRT